MQIGSSTSNRTGMNSRVNFQFMLKLELDQSVSTMPSNGEMASFGRFAGPRTKRLYAAAECETASADPPSRCRSRSAPEGRNWPLSRVSGAIIRFVRSSPPIHVAVKAFRSRTSQPL